MAADEPFRMALIAGALVFAMMVVRTKREESFLVARFGGSYREYMARTGRFLPC